jgi:hypothetical protein
MIDLDPKIRFPDKAKPLCIQRRKLDDRASEQALWERLQDLTKKAYFGFFDERTDGRENAGQSSSGNLPK